MQSLILDAYSPSSKLPKRPKYKRQGLTLTVFIRTSVPHTLIDVVMQNGVHLYAASAAIFVATQDTASCVFQ